LNPSFFEPIGENFQATAHTTGPWHPDFQHAGPPSALLTREIERVANSMQIVRFGVDLLKPIPITKLHISINKRTPGKRRAIIEAEMSVAATGQLVARAQALLIRVEAIPLDSLPNNDPASPKSADVSQAMDFGFFKTTVGYHTAMELRLASGGFGTGRTQMWMRQKVPLLPDEPTSPLQRLMTVADSGNGVSMIADKSRYSFANPDLTVNIRRPPEGEWLCLDAMTHFQDNGIGMAESRIWDSQGVVANGNQNLLLEKVEP